MLFLKRVDRFITVFGADCATNDLSLSDGKWILEENSLRNLAKFAHALFIRKDFRERSSTHKMSYPKGIFLIVLSVESKCFVLNIIHSHCRC